MASLHDLFNQPFDHYHRYFPNVFSGFLSDYSKWKYDVLFDNETQVIKIEMYKDDDDNVLTLFIQSDENQNLNNDEWLAIVQLMRAIQNRK